MSQLHTIGELAKLVGLTPTTIRYYEEIGLICPQRAENGYRVYTNENQHQLQFIIRAKFLGLTLDEIKTILHSANSGLCDNAKANLNDMINQKISEIDKQIQELNQLKIFLQNQTKKLLVLSSPSNDITNCSCLD